ncbi:peptidyl-prolyl cis-trans isomerase [Aquiflexum sp. TKW24L]|uniref:peptidyl-prolyl cis-trans isomerase n=1 Tax=Aquiflexum sp. TKW24L TaxID=2942212 RepID=UPI0020BE3E28|nr:peptidyl-prolyl cis-trans isomerase [Aquiflexum sp. TKW24L]MCL6259180.1 peptidyl-prolyl cis-trans isomerase [Aquiflexum sp. TKW24L]
MRWRSNLVILFFLSTISACDFFRFKSQEEVENDPILATVDNQNLHWSELLFIGSESKSVEDSANLANRYVQSWVRKQLLIKEAGKSMAFDEAEINRKLLDYKYALMVYEFEKKYVEENLDYKVSQKEIEDYYQVNKVNFSLKEIIVRLNFVKIEKGSAQNSQVERLLRSQSQKDSDSFKELAANSGTNYFLEDSTWIKLDDIIINTPLANHPNKVELVRSNKYVTTEDERFKYLIKIIEYKLQDQVPPLEFVREEITKILINKRRIELVDQLQKEVYNRALEKNEFKIYE